MSAIASKNLSASKLANNDQSAVDMDKNFFGQHSTKLKPLNIKSGWSVGSNKAYNMEDDGKAKIKLKSVMWVLLKQKLV